MATAELDDLTSHGESRREPEINKLFRGDEIRGVGLAPQSRTASDDAAQRRHPPHGLAANFRRADGKTDLPDYDSSTEEDPGRDRRGRLRPRRRRTTSDASASTSSGSAATWALVARRVSNKVPTFEKLGLPPSIEQLCKFDQGMIILAGVTGSGKSTTIASMLDYINEREQVHILTIEDPIEYVFTDKKCGHQPARDRHRRQRLADRSEARRPRRPRHHARRRNARPRHVRRRVHRRRDGPLGVRHDPRLVRRHRRRAVFSTCSRPTCTRPFAKRWPST